MNEVYDFRDLTHLCHNLLVLVEVNPVGLVDIPATLTMNHMAVLSIAGPLRLLLVDHILSQVHLVHVSGLIEGDLESGTRNENRLRLQVAVLHDLVGVECLLLPFLVLDRSKEEIRLFLQSKSDRFVDINAFVPLEASHGTRCVAKGTD